MKDYCGGGIREENENQGGQGKDRGEIKSGGLRKIGDHDSVCVVNMVVGRINSSVQRVMCCQQLRYQRQDGWTTVKGAKSCI